MVLNFSKTKDKLAYTGRAIHYIQMSDVKDEGKWDIRNETWFSTEPFACDGNLALLWMEEVSDYVYEIENEL